MNAGDRNQEIRNAPNRSSYQVAKTIGRLTDCIYDIMRERGLNNSQLAVQLGKSRAWVGKLLSGDHNMTVKTAVTVFHELGHTLDFAVEPAVRYNVDDIKTEIVIEDGFNDLMGEHEYLQAA